MQRVVLGYDGSDASASALEWIAERARRTRIDLDVVLVTNMFLSDRVEADRVLDAAARRWRDLVPGSWANVLRVDGLVPATLASAARGADLLVLGVDAGSRTRTTRGGGMPLRTAVSAGVPTALVPAGWTAVDAPVVVGLDDDDSSGAALLFAASAASSAEVPLHVLHAWLMGAPRATASVASRPSSRRTADTHARIVDAAVDRVREGFPALSVTTELVRDNPTSALTRAAAHASLLVIGSHGRGAVAGSLLGSVGWDLVGRLDRPMCVVPAGRSTTAHAEAT